MMGSKALVLLGLAAAMVLVISSEARDSAETSKETTNVGEVKAGCPICCIRGKCGCCAPPQQAEEVATRGGSTRGDIVGGGGCSRKLCNCCVPPVRN